MASLWRQNIGFQGVGVSLGDLPYHDWHNAALLLVCILGESSSCT